MADSKTILTCCWCHLPKEGNRDEFHKDKSRRDGLAGACKTCRTKYLKEYRQRPEIIKKAREYRQRPENIQKTRAYRQKPENIRKVREYDKRPENIRRAREYRQRPENIKKDRERQYIRKYGLTIDQYDQLFDLQGGRCAICESEDPGSKGHFHVDHNHHTGKIRGLLCNSCNLLLGLSKDNVETLISAARYLERQND